MIYFSKTPKILPYLFKDLTWRVNTKEKVLFLTFDDGPTPEITFWVLDLLEQYNAKATFFCVGDNVVKHPAIYKQIKEKGHVIGNHTFNHLNGWRVKGRNYVQNVALCAENVDSKLFRPPYGKLTFNQIKQLNHRQYKIIMWDVISGDFDITISKEKCYNNVLKNTENGSIIVFHDSEKAAPNMEYALENTLAHFSRLGYKFKGLSNLITPFY